MDWSAKLNDMNIPFSRRRLFLKQVNAEDMGDDGRVFRTLFKSFSGSIELSNPAEDSTLVGKFRQAMPDTPFIQDDRVPRRFAGDTSLSRGRYYTLCNQDGEDAGALIAELEHYLKPSEFVTLLDTSIECHAKSAQEFKSRIGASVVVARLWPIFGHNHPIVQEFELAQNVETVDLAFPIRIQEKSFERVVDLREPATLEWLKENLISLHWCPSETDRLAGFPAFPGLPKFKDLNELLTSILVLDTGGGQNVTQIIGLMFRRLGADALIFPSVRVDPAVIVSSKTIIACTGWHLVDYSGSKESHVDIPMFFGNSWPQEIGFEDKSVSDHREWLNPIIAVESDGDLAGTWAVRGLHDWRLNKRRAKMLAFLHENLSRFRPGHAILDLFGPNGWSTDRFVKMCLEDKDLMPFAYHWFNLKSNWPRQ
jgi:hypothetical protein